MKDFLKRFKCSITKNPGVIFFLNGIFFASFFFLFINSQYENELYEKIAKKVKTESIKKGLTQQQTVVAAMNMTYSLQHNRLLVFDNEKYFSFKSKYMRSSDLDLMDAIGACGSHAMVLARLLKNMGFIVRVGQMKVKGIYGGHIIMEVMVNGKWIVLDPTFNVCFKETDTSYASAIDVKRNWAKYQQQLPVEYVGDYRYEDIRYTNWDKIPIAGNMAKNILIIWKGKNWTQNFSLRSYILNMYNLYMLFLFILYIPILVFTIIVLDARLKIRKKIAS
jgi:hypothetical protein